ncbi:MAG: ATP-dependent endonuclease [Candidatus Thorarchaeota archaeon]
MAFKIKRFQIDRFKGLSKINLQDIGNFNILVGQNNSGKSNVLDAMEAFFTIWNGTLKDTSGVHDSIWPNYLKEGNIDWLVEVEISGRHLLRGPIEDAVGSDLADQVRELFALTGKPDILRKNHIFRIKLENASSSGHWHTEFVELNGVKLANNYEWLNSVGPKASQWLVQTLAGIFKNGFRRLDIIGNTKTTSLLNPNASRRPIIRESTLSEIVKWNNDQTSDGFYLYNEFQKAFQRLSGTEIELRGENLFVKQSTVSLPIQAFGSGSQQLVELAYELAQNSGVLVLEEPEAHMHPSMRIELLKLLLEFSRRQQIFITTHSPTFINQVPVENIWLVQKTYVTKCEKIENPESLSNVMATLGIQTSDIFMSKCLLFVEGPTEKILIPEWSRQLGFELTAPHVSIIEMGGIPKVKHKAEFWKPLAESLLIREVLIFDGDVSNRFLSDMISIGIAEHSMRKLDLTSIEDYYPKEPLKEFITETYSISSEFQDELDSILDSKDRVTKIYNLLMRSKAQPQPRHKNEWKVEAAIRMSKEDVPDPFKPHLLWIIDIVKGSNTTLEGA